MARRRKLPACPLCGLPADDPRRPAVYCRRDRECIEATAGRSRTGGRSWPWIEDEARRMRSLLDAPAQDAPAVQRPRRRKTNVATAEFREQ